MYSKLQQLVEQKNAKEIEKFVEQSDTEELSTMISSRVTDRNLLQYLKELLKGFTSAESSQTKGRKLIHSILKSLKTAKVNIYHLNNLLNLIILHLQSYSKHHLLKFVNYCLHCIQTNSDENMCWKNLLPILLHALEEEKYVTYNGSEFSGTEFKSVIIDTICKMQWDPAILTSLAEMFRSISSLDKNDHKLILKTLCDKVSVVPPTDLPPLVHQLLKFCNEQDSKLLLDTLRRYFAKLHDEATDSESADSINEIGVVSAKEIEEAETTTLYYIHEAADTNKLVGFIRYLKTIVNAPEYVLDPFVISVLLISIHMYGDEVFDVLRQAIIRKLSDDEKRAASAWLAHELIDDYTVLQVIDDVVRNNAQKGQLIIRGLLDFAFDLMDNEKKIKDKNTALCDIGIAIVQKLVRKIPIVASTVLQTISEKIYSSGISVSQYTDCLAYLCRRSPLLVLDSQGTPIITQLVEILPRLSGVAPREVYNAILPILHRSPIVRDILFIVLRKSLTRKSTNIREMAITGYLHFLTNLKTSSINPLSQIGNSSSSSVSCASNSVLSQITLERPTQAKLSPQAHATLCSDILSVLKRCFTQEFEVRVHLYQSLSKTVVANPEVAEYVIKFLLTHFEIYYEIDENILPPLKFDLCTNTEGGEAILEEPLGDFIFSLQKIYVKSADCSSNVIDILAMKLESLCTRMAHIEEAHLHLDDGSDLLDNSLKSQQKLNNLKLIFSTFEALITYRIDSWSLESEVNAQNTKSLFKRYHEFVEFTKRVSKPKKAEGGRKKKDKDQTNTSPKNAGRPVAIQIPSTIMHLSTISKALSLIFMDSVPWATRDQANTLKNYPEFKHYILECCIQLLKKAKSLQDAELRRHKEDHRKTYLEVSSTLYKHVVHKLDTAYENDSQTTALALETFNEMCDLMCTSFSSDLPVFINTICGTNTRGHLNMLIQAFIFSIKDIINSTLDKDDEENIYLKKIQLLLLEIVAHFVKKLSFDKIKSDEILSWMCELKDKDNIQDPLVISILLQMIFSIEEKSKEDGSLLKDACNDLCYKLGSIDKSETTVSEVFQIINENTALQCHTFVNNAINEKLNNISWMLTRLKAEQVIAAPSETDELDCKGTLRKKERSVCNQLTHITSMLMTLTNTSIDPGPNAVAVFKNVHYLYSLLCNLTKYFHAKSTAQNPSFQQVKFVQVIQNAGKPLKQSVFEFITHMEAQQSETTGKTSDTYAQRRKVLKDTKIIPKVIAELERFSQDVAQLGKKTEIPLESFVKQGITRDFRIKEPQLREGLEEMDTSALGTQTQGSVHPSGSRSRINDDTSETESSLVTVDEASPPPSKKSRK